MKIIEFYTDNVEYKEIDRTVYGEDSFGFTRDIHEILFGKILSCKKHKGIIIPVKPMRYRVTVEIME